MERDALAGEMFRHQRAARLDKMNLARTSGQQNCKHSRSATDVDHRWICWPARQNEIRGRLEPLEHRVAYRRIGEHICRVELINAVWIEAGIVNVTATGTGDDVEDAESRLEAERRRWTDRMDGCFLDGKYRLRTLRSAHDAAAKARTVRFGSERRLRDFHRAILGHGCVIVGRLWSSVKMPPGPATPPGRLHHPIGNRARRPLRYREPWPAGTRA